MKFLWQLNKEFKSNKLSSVLIFVEIVFVLVCFCICIALSDDCFSAARYFHSRFDGKSVTAVLNKADKSRLAEAFENEAVDVAVTVNYYYAEGKDGSAVYIGDYSKSAFTDLDLSYSGELTDTEKDYGNAVPAMVSKPLSEEYLTGNTYSIKGVDFYICGALEDRNLWLMTAQMTNENFLMCYDSKGLLSELNKSNSSCGFFSAADGYSELKLASVIGENECVKAVSVFDWREKMSEDFDRLSGNLVVGILVFIISAAGLCANNILTIKKNERTFYCQLCVGQKKSAVIMLFAARLGICLAAGIAVVIFAMNKINEYLGQEIVTIKKLTAASGICLVLCAVSVVILAFKRNFTPTE